MTTCKRLAPTGDLEDFLDWLDAYEAVAVPGSEASDDDVEGLWDWLEAHKKLIPNHIEEVENAIANWACVYLGKFSPDAAATESHHLADAPAATAPGKHPHSASAPANSGAGRSLKPWYPRFPDVTRVSALRMQYFDDGQTPARVSRGTA